MSLQVQDHFGGVKEYERVDTHRVELLSAALRTVQARVPGSLKSLPQGFFIRQGIFVFYPQILL